MPQKRPVYLNLTQIHLPLPGFISILHRFSGVLMVLSLPFLIYLLDVSLRGDAGYNEVVAIFGNMLVKLIFMVLSWALLHHLLAGIRYLLIDIGVGVERATTRKLSWVVLGISIVAILPLWRAIW